MSTGELAVMHPLETARVVSSVPGRLRLRLPTGAASGRRLAAAVDALSASAAVSTATARWQTTSLVVKYDVANTDAVWSQLAQLGLDSRASRATEAQEDVEPSTRVTRAIIGANEAVRRRAGGNDLRTFVPLGFGLLALRQFVRDDQRLADAPWYLLAWYASETFQKFHQPRKGSQDG